MTTIHGTLESVGIRELKARLSEYLERAAAGEAILVTERGKPKAVLAPLTERARIEQGIREGWIIPAERKTGWQRPGRARFSITETIQEVFDEGRADRFD